MRSKWLVLPRQLVNSFSSLDYSLLSMDNLFKLQNYSCKKINNLGFFYCLCYTCSLALYIHLNRDYMVR